MDPTLVDDGAGRSLDYDTLVVDTGRMTRADGGSTLLGPLEAEVMRTLWSAAQPMTVRAVLDALNRGRSPVLAYTTVMTVMARLTDKEALRRRRQGRGYVYEPAVPDTAALAVRDVVREFGESAVARFVDEARADPKLLRRLERVLREP